MKYDSIQQRRAIHYGIIFLQSLKMLVNRETSDKYVLTDIVHCHPSDQPPGTGLTSPILAASCLACMACSRFDRTKSTPMAIMAMNRLQATNS